jgi:hypothetical protein
MPSYDLQHATASGGTTDCGNVVVSMSGGNPPTPVINYRAQGQTGNGTKINTASYTPKAGGNGTAMNPAAGDTLNLGGFQATGADGNLYTFDNTATYRDPGNSQGGGYFTMPGVTGGADDWDAADQGPDPKATY